MIIDRRTMYAYNNVQSGNYAQENNGKEDPNESF